jgi:hypothetical protein
MHIFTLGVLPLQKQQLFVRQQILSRRGLSVVLIVGLFSAAVPPAIAYKSEPPSPRSRIRALARAFMNAALPSVGLLPDEAEEIPTDGEKYELKLTRAHTGERIDVVYRIGNTYSRRASAAQRLLA